MKKIRKVAINISIDGIHFFSFYMAIAKQNENFLNVAIFMSWLYAVLCFLSSLNQIDEWSKRVEDSNPVMEVYHWITWAVVTLILAYIGFFTTAAFYALTYILFKVRKSLAIEKRDKQKVVTESDTQSETALNRI